MNQTPMTDELPLDSLIARLSDEFMERLKRGESPSVEEFVDRHPQYANVNRNVLTSLQFMHLAGADSLGPAASSEIRIQPGRLLGDYRIVREIGRGGTKQQSDFRHRTLSAWTFRIFSYTSLLF